MTPARRGTVARYPAACAPGYIEWFARISHLQVQHPDRRCAYDPRHDTVHHSVHLVSRALSVLDPAFDNDPDQTSAELWSPVCSAHLVLYDQSMHDSRGYVHRRRGRG